MIWRLKFLIVSLCFAVTLPLQAFAQQQAQTGVSQGHGQGVQARQEMQALRQKAEELHSQIEKLEAQIKSLREQLRSVHEKLRADREKIKNKHKGRREESLEHKQQQGVQGQSTQQP